MRISGENQYFYKKAVTYGANELTDSNIDAAIALLNDENRTDIRKSRILIYLNKI
jgi:hypothetical protein